ncbi:MotA/TolQ/ExbB proton channel family protein [Aquimarina sp. D1M17]|uniref:MotA/TolQ/ExbB proton channel family protein n=1 Tax=Aquimarina acroporae TaxID=2937283 RepID=UPI0020BF9511|nr:MotA/TolQ/ExbB proton channel family protein [Aquimarina acroporae]MCK8524040.1 MotA/TolQ/ExbB proton channel family protein [Aquimarina acroporae]
MTLLFFIQPQDHSAFAHILHLLHDGGLFFMVPILMTLLLILFLIVRNVLVFFKEKRFSTKYIKLINSLGLLILVWGILGQLIGLIEALDRIDMIGDISTNMLAGGLKVSALPTLFGSFVFVVSRAATTIFIWIQKES